MDLFWEHFGALLHLVAAAVCVIAAVQVFLEHRSVLGMVFWLSFGAAFSALGSFDLLGLMPQKWLDVSKNVVLGMFLTIGGIAGLCSPPAPSYPRWTQWATLVFGVGSILWAIIVGLG